MTTINRRQVLKTAGVGILMGGLAGCSSDGDNGDGSGDGNEDNQNTPEPTPSSTPTPEGPPTHEIGESFIVGSGEQSIRYTVVEATTADAIGTETVNEEADGRFLIIILRMENVGSESLDISTNNLKLVDSENREFDADTGASVYIEQDPRFDVEGVSFTQLQPGLEVTRAVIFDVVPGNSYAFKADPQGLFSDADSHYVPLGTVPE